MEYENQNIEYNNIIETLINTFGEVLSRDVLYNIVEAFNGDLEQSANAVMNIIMEENNDNNTQPDSTVDIFRRAVEETTQPIPNSSSTACPDTPISFSKIAASTNASTRVQSPVYRAATSSSPDISQNFWTDQIQLILSHHENGVRILILMRGLPGSGKTYLAKKIIDAIYYTKNQHYATHIMSTDDYFMRNGRYMHDVSRLHEAHLWNQERATKAMTEGVSPVVIDNTNIELWEMQCYVTQGVKNGYIVEVIEPNTPWARKVFELSKRNSHNVPAATIRRKLENFQSGISGEYLIKSLNLQYLDCYKPPVLRSIPPLSLNIAEQSTYLDDHVENAFAINTISSTEEKQENRLENECNSLETPIAASTLENTNDKTDSCDESSDLAYNIDQFAKIHKCLEEIEKVEKEWDNGDTWDDNFQKKSKDRVNTDGFNSKPQRRNKSMETGTENYSDKFITPDEVCQDWSSCFKLLPSWEETTYIKEMECKPAVETKTSSTCIEYGDINLSPSKHLLKVITAVPRNINEYHVAVSNKKMPAKWMLDKSTSTNNNDILRDTFDCPNKEQHFTVFRKLFRNIARSDLRDIFDNCLGDVNWAVNIVLQGRARNELDIVVNDDCSDTEAEEHIDNVDLCQCLAAYEVIPYNNDSSPPPTPNFEKNVNEAMPSTSKSKGKKENVLSESSLQLKRQIEQNVVISDDHYSEHCLKIRKFRRGECTDEAVPLNQQIHTDDVQTLLHTTDDEETITSSNVLNTASHSQEPSTSTSETAETYAGDSSVVNEDVERSVNITLGKECISQLDEIFGRSNIEYPSFVIPKINMPMSLLNEINALWMESLMNQIEENITQSQIIIQQDKEFAMQLAKKEAELLSNGKEPEVPDFKEIMDMDFALSLYHKDVAEWRNSVPDDMAAKLTRDKLSNLFPDFSKDLLTEVLMAHDNNFQETVESLLMSTGQAKVLEPINGLGKFIMEKEMERCQKLLDEKKKVYEVEWPLLPTVEKLEMSDVDKYRVEAERHLKARDYNYFKAQEYIRRGIMPAASYTSDVAAYHRKMYDISNSKAAMTLIHIRAAESDDKTMTDLHYMRVVEAIQTLDISIDWHISNLKEIRQKNGGVNTRTLFFITGRGLHSNGGPRIKPAVKKRLAERGLTYKQKNPGLLSVNVSADSKLTYEIA
ncbi:uncharacterized protein LOC112048318 isoform X2 [Bicyclus anynana]|uniref:Uncharacterized protein LOC112048318 isoform X2 n=1 Tax=Bicyclus anynana TaxID=110368 RepID=A0A6J1N136_BICAN|nr:uncharacterized protein LOC112048318 isoform X2 [Bicyclus anynana]